MTTSRTSTVTVIAGRRYGHVPGHAYLDVTVCLQCDWTVRVTVERGSGQGTERRADGTYRSLDQVDSRRTHHIASLGHIPSRLAVLGYDAETVALAEQAGRDALAQRRPS